MRADLVVCLLQCTAQQAAFVGSPDAIDRELYCGFYQVNGMTLFSRTS